MTSPSSQVPSGADAVPARTQVQPVPPSAPQIPLELPVAAPRAPATDLPALTGPAAPERARAPFDASSPAAPVGLVQRLRRVFFGPPRRLDDRRVFHRVSLIALLAWVGLGADGLSSSAYGPEEAFRTLGEHTYLAVILAAMMAGTVLLISAAYRLIIEHFPSGGGGYVVASRLLGPKVGLVSGCALLVDYVLTIAISVAAAGDALFSFLPPAWHAWKLPLEAACVGGLTCLNIRGVRESVMILAPVFALFVVTHVLAIGYGVLGHIPEMPGTARAVGEGFENGMSTLGVAGMLVLLLHAFSLGGGTYTGIEAVSNGVPIMRPPQVRTAKRTMVYMALSLAFTATGLLLCYLLWQIEPVSGKTMNAVLVERLGQGWTFGHLFVLLFLVAEGGILIVAAQAGFADGPRVLANMAADSWAPRRFSALSERLTTQNGVVLMGLAGLAALIYTRGDVRHLVVMYSINVFLTFSLSLLAMTREYARSGGASPRPAHRRRRLALFGAGFAVCATILVLTIIEKFSVGGWITLVVTGGAIALCVLVRAHYDRVAGAMGRVFSRLTLPDDRLAALASVAQNAAPLPDPSLPTAVILVGGYNGFGVHTMLNALRAFPNHFKGMVFLSVGVMDAGRFKGEDTVDALAAETESIIAKYVAHARSIGMPATGRFALGTDAVHEAERLCLETLREYPRCTFFAGQVVFTRDSWLRRLLHNQTAFAIQRRLQLFELNLVILPARIQDLHR